MTLHSSTHKGKRVLIILKDGTKHVGKFKDSKSGLIYTEDRKFRKKDVRSMTICKASGWKPRES